MTGKDVTSTTNESGRKFFGRQFFQTRCVVTRDFAASFAARFCTLPTRLGRLKVVLDKTSYQNKSKFTTEDQFVQHVNITINIIITHAD